MSLSRIPWWASLLLPLIVSLIVSGFAGYYSNDKQIESRVSALEAHRSDDASKLDHIQSQVDRLVQWALGK